MNTTILHQLSPEDLHTILADVLRQASGPQSADAITAAELPDLSASDAARYLGCSVAHLSTIVERWPLYLRPITEGGKATRYRTSELINVKNKGLVKRKP